MKNIVLFGGSNSVMVNGLQKGLREYANVTNLALGGSAAIQNLYELCRERNQEAIKNADLIVTESNINEIDNHNLSEISFDLILKHLEFFYASLYKLNKNICVIILPRWCWLNLNEKINNMHRNLANYFGFNIIDVQKYYLNANLRNFGHKFGPHQLSVINRNIGKNIAKNIDNFKISNNKITISLPIFKAIEVSEMEKHGKVKTFKPKNSMFDEIVYRLEKDNYLSIKGYDGWNFIGLHSWNLENDGPIPKKHWGDVMNYWGCFVFEGYEKIAKYRSISNQFCEIQANIKLKENSKIYFNSKNIEPYEYSWPAIIQNNRKPKEILPYFDLIGILICSPYDEKTLLNIDEIPDDKIIEIDPELDFSHLIPNIEFFRDSMEFIDEYIAHLYPQIRKDIENALLTPLRKRLEALENKAKSNKTELTATERIQNQLSYKLGKAMIENSKSIKDYFRLPFILYKIKKAHKAPLNQPKIESLPDYKEALKLKNHLSYKLGQALIKADKYWFCGGYIWLIFEIQKIKKNHKK